MTKLEYLKTQLQLEKLRTKVDPFVLTALETMIKHEKIRLRREAEHEILLENWPGM